MEQCYICRFLTSESFSLYAQRQQAINQNKRRITLFLAQTMLNAIPSFTCFHLFNKSNSFIHSFIHSIIHYFIYSLFHIINLHYILSELHICLQSFQRGAWLNLLVQFFSITEYKSLVQQLDQFF